MTHYNITICPPEKLRWLDALGNEQQERGRYDYLFRSATTDAAQKMLKMTGFDGQYIRSFHTGHSETEWIGLALLCLAQVRGGIVGVTLDGLVRDKVAGSLIGYPAGRILYEVLEAPHAFKVFTDRAATPEYFEGYPEIDCYRGFLGHMKFVPDKRTKGIEKHAHQIQRRVYIEFQPDALADLGSIDLRYGPLEMSELRVRMKELSQQGYDTSPTLFSKIRSYLPF